MLLFYILIFIPNVCIFQPLSVLTNPYNIRILFNIIIFYNIIKDYGQVFKKVFLTVFKFICAITVLNEKMQYCCYMTFPKSAFILI